MMRGFLCATLSALAPSFIMAVLAPAPPAVADGMRVRVRHHHHQWHHRRFVLPPERHVVEINRPPYSGSYTINGTRFAATSANCTRWIPGERVRLVAGDWHGACTTALIYNVRRRQTCELSCR
jgi:hypothetical protein